MKAWCQQSRRCPDKGCAYRITAKEILESMSDGSLLAFDSHAEDCVIYLELEKRGPLHPLWFLGLGDEKGGAGRKTAKKGRKVGA